MNRAVLGRMALPQNEAHIWWADPAELGSASRADARAILTHDEIVRLERFHREPDRLLFLATRVLVRTVLSRYASVAPADWRFAADEYGRPHISGHDQPRLSFNLSHTSGLVVCAVARDTDVGVDAERVRSKSVLGIADRFFAPQEAAALHALPPDEQLRCFYDYWTLKESYIKARGQGLRIPLDRFAMVLDDGNGPHIEVDPGTDDDGEAWQFLQYRPTGEHIVSLCIRRCGAMDVTVVTRRQQLS